MWGLHSQPWDLGRVPLVVEMAPPPCWASLVAQTVKNPPAMQEIQVQSLGGEDPLEEKMTSHSSILAWEIPWTKETGRLQSLES